MQKASQLAPKHTKNTASLLLVSALLTFYACKQIDFSDEERLVVNESMRWVEAEIFRVDFESRKALGRVSVKIKNSGFRADYINQIEGFKSAEKVYLDLKARFRLARDREMDIGDLLPPLYALYDTLSQFASNERPFVPRNLDDRWFYSEHEPERSLLLWELELDAALSYRDAVSFFSERFGNQDIRFYIPFFIAYETDSGMNFQMCVEGQYLSIDSLNVHPAAFNSVIEEADALVFHLDTLPSTSNSILEVVYWEEDTYGEPNRTRIDSITSLSRIDLYKW